MKLVFFLAENIISRFTNKGKVHPKALFRSLNGFTMATKFIKQTILHDLMILSVIFNKIKLLVVKLIKIKKIFKYIHKNVMKATNAPTEPTVTADFCSRFCLESFTELM